MGLLEEAEVLQEAEVALFRATVLGVSVEEDIPPMAPLCAVDGATLLLLLLALPPLLPWDESSWLGCV